MLKKTIKGKVQENADIVVNLAILKENVDIDHRVGLHHVLIRGVHQKVEARLSSIRKESIIILDSYLDN